MDILKDMMYSEGIGKNNKLQSRIKKFLAHKEERPEDAEIIPYDEWLKKKSDVMKVSGR